MTVFVLYLFYLSLIYISFRVFGLERNSGFSLHVLFLVFLIKCLAGSVNLYIHQELFITNDITFYHQQSVLELKEARHHPILFLQHLFFNWENMGDHLNFFKEENMVYWSTLGTLIHTKLFTLFNLLSFGHIYVDVILYNVLFFLGQLALYKTFYAYSPDKKMILLLSIFFIPSVLFWCSGMHKDGLVLSVIGGLSWHMRQYVFTQLRKYLVYVIILFLLLTTIRYFYSLCLLPAILLWWLSIRTEKPLVTFLIAYSLLIGLFFTLPTLTGVDTMGMVAHRQEEFFHAKGYSDMETPQLENSVASYMKNFPIAIQHIFMRPLFHVGDPLKYRVASIDTLCTLVIIGLSIIFLKRRKFQEPFFLFSLFFSLSVLLFIGYTIPNCGALVRYKSAFIAILIPTLLSLSEWKKRKVI